MNRRVNNLTVCYDPGTSLSKILYRLGQGKVKYLTMESEVIKLPLSSVSDSILASTNPKHNAWVRLSEEDDCYLVGRLARERRASVSIKKLKYESLVPKILAAVAAIATTEKLNPEFDLRLAVLLPFGEYASRNYLEIELRKAIECFWFQEQNFKINLKDYLCNIEGFGIALSDLKTYGLKQFQNSHFVYLMLGYRNTSLLVFKEGSLSRNASQTTQQGFYDLIDKIVAGVSGLNRDEIQAAIHTYELGFYNAQIALRDYRSVTEIAVGDLIKSSDLKKADLEMETITKAIDRATQDYWQILKNWLDEVLPPLRQLDRMIVCGGTSDFFKDYITNYFQSKNQFLKLSQTNLLENELLAALKLDEYEQKEFKKHNLALRFADVWGLFTSFTGYQLGQTNSSAA
jgi:hypothetical protein